MASFYATFFRVSNRGLGGGVQPVPQAGDALGCTVLTTGASSVIVQRSAADFVAPFDGYLRIRSTGAVWVQVGTAPTAAAASDWYIPADTDVDFSMNDGEKIAVIDA